MSHRTLTAESLVAGYERGRPVLEGASLTVPAGRRLAVLGANGSGKTTLLRCLSGALRPDIPFEAIDAHVDDDAFADVVAERYLALVKETVDV